MTLQRAPFILGLDLACEPSRAGNKAANLARLTASGFRVPEAIVVAAGALDALVWENDLGPSIEALCGRLEGKSSLAVQCAAETVSALIDAAALPAGFAEELTPSLAALGPGPYAVRSSAVGEDSDAASFAGQFDSVLHVRSEDEVIAAIRRVWASRWSARVLGYENASRVALAGVGVVIQRQIDAACSGVLFTEAPARDGHLIVELCAGFGDALVSGSVTPVAITIPRSALTSSPGCIDGANGLLPATDVVDLATTGLAIERLYDRPQDIEWVRDRDGVLWIVQARPIVLRRAAATRGPIVRWSNANINENFPAPVTPLLYSIAGAGYYHYFRNLGRSFGITRRRLEGMEQPLRHIIGSHGARLYYNLTSIHAVLRSAPFGDLLAGSFDQFVGAESTDTAPAVPFHAPAGGRVRQVLEVSRIALFTAWQYTFVHRRVSRFERTVACFAEETRQAGLVSASIDQLLSHVRAFMDIRCHRWNDAALADAGSMVCYGLLQRMLTRAFPGGDESALTNSLLKALPDLVSGQPAVELWKLAEAVKADEELHSLFMGPAHAAPLVDTLGRDPRFAAFRRRLQAFQDEWGFRCSGELMLTVPGFHEDAAPLLDIIRGYVRSSGASPSAVMDREAADRRQQTARVRRALRRRIAAPVVPQFLQPAVVMRVLASTQGCVRLRERARLKQALLYSRLRQVILALGRRLTTAGALEQPGDLFFLTVDEIDALCTGSAMFPDVRPLIALRRAEHAALSAQAPPDTMSLPAGAFFAADAAADSPTAAGSPLEGVGACGGRATARAVVLSDVTEAGRLNAGDILVTRQTDPGWGPVFPLIAGLVVERGGMLSHGAIIAREFGIPSVVGVRDATSRVPAGRMVTVDGDRGLVHVLEANP